ncbi:hypothetical protein ACFLQ2_02750 [archaeon]
MELSWESISSNPRVRAFVVGGLVTFLFLLALVETDEFGALIVAAFAGLFATYATLGIQEKTLLPHGFALPSMLSPFLGILLYAPILMLTGGLTQNNFTAIAVIGAPVWFFLLLPTVLTLLVVREVADFIKKKTDSKTYNTLAKVVVLGVGALVIIAFALPFVLSFMARSITPASNPTPEPTLVPTPVAIVGAYADKFEWAAAFGCGPAVPHDDENVRSCLEELYADTSGAMSFNEWLSTQPDLADMNIWGQENRYATYLFQTKYVG